MERERMQVAAQARHGSARQRLRGERRCARHPVGQVAAHTRRSTVRQRRHGRQKVRGEPEVCLWLFAKVVEPRDERGFRRANPRE
jgi:hypothetical protein